MGSRDKGHRETKKQKKDPKKLPQVSILPPPVEVEVIKKGKKKKEEWEEEG
jgi:hypothetical protein